MGVEVCYKCFFFLKCVSWSCLGFLVWRHHLTCPRFILVILTAPLTVRDTCVKFLKFLKFLNQVHLVIRSVWFSSTRLLSRTTVALMYVTSALCLLWMHGSCPVLLCLCRWQCTVTVAVCSKGAWMPLVQTFGSSLSTRCEDNHKN